VTGASACQEMRESAAVTLLRGEPLPADVLAHNARCPACQAEHERLAVLTPLLAATRDADVTPVEVPDEALLRRLLAELARHRRRRRLLVVAVAAAAAVVLAVPIGAWFAGRTDGRGTATPSVSTSPPAEGVLVAAGTGQDSGSDAGARVEVLALGEGRGSTLIVAPWGIDGGTRCRIALVDSAGSERTVQTWIVPDGYRTGWSSRTEVSIAPREITDVLLVDEATGRVIVNVPVEKA